MKFKTIGYKSRQGMFGNIAEYYIQSLDGRYMKTISPIKYSRFSSDGCVNYFGTSCLARVCNRLQKIGVNLELEGNLPWVYLKSVNNLQVKGCKNAQHGWCIHMLGDERNLTFRKDLFTKIREILNEN